LAPETPDQDEDIRHGLMDVIQGSPEVLMSILENAVSMGDKALLRDVIDAAFILYSHKEADLPGGRDFWEKMRTNIASQVPQPAPAGTAETRARRRRAMDVFQKALFSYGSTHPELKRRLDEHERRRLSPFAPASVTSGTGAPASSTPGASSSDAAALAVSQSVGPSAGTGMNGGSAPRKSRALPVLDDELDSGTIARRRSAARTASAPSPVQTPPPATTIAPSSVPGPRAADTGDAPSRAEIDAAFTVGKSTRPEPAVKVEPVVRASTETTHIPDATVVLGSEKGADMYAAALPFFPTEKAQTPEAIVPAGDRSDAAVAELRAMLEKKDSELRQKDALLHEYEADMKRIYEQLKLHEAIPDVKAIEERLAIQEEEARMAREDLAKMENKYRENLELLKGEARDRGTLQMKLETMEAELGGAEARLRDEENRLADARRELDVKEAELRKLDERVHVAELELVRKEEEIKIAMQHLREEESERRRVLESLRNEAREKAQMEHRLKKRETELARLEAKLVDDEKRLEALKGSQAVSEEEGLKRGDALKAREGELRRLESETKEKLLRLKREEETLKQDINERREELRDMEKAEAALKKKEELFAATEGRLRSKEDALTREMVELERTKAQLSKRETDASTNETAPQPEKARAPERVTVPAMDERTLRRDDILELLSKRVRKTEK